MSLITLGIIMIQSCQEQEILHEDVALLPEYNSIMPDKELISFTLNIASNILDSEVSNSSDGMISSLIQPILSEIESSQADEFINSYELYQSINASSNSNARQSSAELSAFTEDFLVEFSSNFNESVSLENYRDNMNVLMEDYNSRNLTNADVTFIINFLAIMELYFVLAEEAVSVDEVNNYRINCNWWCRTKNFVSEVGDCAGQTLQAIASDPVYSAATVVATAATGGSAAAYGLAGIAIGCTINVATR